MTDLRPLRRFGWMLAALLLAATLVVPMGQAPEVAAAPSNHCGNLADVSATYEHCKTIKWLTKHNITKPVGSNYYPNRAVTRGAMATFLYRYTHGGAALPTCDKPPFPDVPAGYVHCGAIQWAAKTHVTAGYPDGTFRPHEPVTRGAMATFLLRIVGNVDHVPACQTSRFTDVSARYVHCGAVQWLAATGVTVGVGKHGQNYAPKRAVTRGSMATFLYRMDRLPSYVKKAPFPPGNAVTTELLSEFNRLRSAANPSARPASIDPSLEKIAYCRSQDQAAEHRMSHDGFTTKTCGLANNKRTVGENVAHGYATPLAALNGWWSSGPHRANIIKSAHVKVGVAVAYSDKGTPYYTMELSSK